MSLDLLSSPYCVERGGVIGYWYPGEHLTVELYKSMISSLEETNAAYKKSLTELEIVVGRLKELSNF